MGERLLCKQEVIGSNPFTSTTHPVVATLVEIAMAGRAPRKPGGGRAC